MSSGGSRKPVPSRASQESNSYSNGNGGQFGGPLDRSGYGSGGGQSNGASGMMSPGGHTILEGYRNDIMTGFQGDKPRYNPLNASRPQSSALVNVNDPIQIHLLVETALGDSKEYEILSQEEVDDLKKQCQALSQRAEQTRQNLAIQSKFRDAAVSMAKLYSSSDKKKSMEGPDGKKRRSLLGHRSQNSDQFREADMERIASERKCEELASELWSLEKRLIEPQSRLLKHTAGILQMTHKGPKKMPRTQGAPQQPGIPGSPESMYTYSNGRSSMEPVSEENIFDERSFYRTADRLDGFDGNGNFINRKSLDPVPPPLKSPSRPTEQMTEQVKNQLSGQLRTIAMTEERLEDLNSRLREVIIKANPQSDESYSRPPHGGKNTIDPGEILSSHLDYLERGIAAIDQEQGRTLKKQQESDKAMEETIEELNREVRELLLPYDQDQPVPPQLTGGSLQEQLMYFRDIIGVVETELSRAASTASNASQTQQNNMDQVETVLMGLWDIIQSGFADIKKKKMERRQTRLAQGYIDDEDDGSDEDMGDPNEPFSLPAFSAKVQWLYTQATSLKERKQVLQRQIKQQRELNSKSDATKDAELMTRTEELQRTRNLLVRTEADADSVREQLSVMMEKLDEAQQAENMRAQAVAGDESAAVRAAQERLAARDNEFNAAQEQLATRNMEISATQEQLAARNREISAAQEELAARNRDLSDVTKEFSTVQGELAARTKQISDLEEQLQDLKDDQSISGAEIQSRLTTSESKIAELNAQLAAAAAAQAKSEEMVVFREKELSDKEAEMDGLFEKVAELQTEVTIARAELDGAYGSRSQRAAEVSANPAIQKELNDLTKKNAALASEIAALQASQSSAGASSKESEEREKMLKKELAETIEEYEQMTKLSIEWEKERESLEQTIDKLRDERESLEAQLSDEKVRWLGMRSPGLEGSTPTSVANTSTTVLKNEFKKMMRDTRAENAKALRAEQEMRRRVEDELRTLKKQQGPGKSGLSQSIGS